jgi:hypothetical protein
MTVAELIKALQALNRPELEMRGTNGIPLCSPAVWQDPYTSVEYVEL